jgi:Protein of unknown function (DUF3089)
MTRAPRVRWAATVVAALALVTGACSSGDDDAEGDDGGAATTEGDAAQETAALPEGWEGHQSEVYADDAHWLCKPGIEDDVCLRDLDATVVNADGSTEVQPHEVAADPAIDCFYVYPTTSRDEGLNSDLEPAENQEIVTVLNQVARLTSECRVFAPVYRQVSLGGIGPEAEEPPEGVDPRAIAYDDVLDAFQHYVANESDGRGFVLIGHSQGAGLLTELIRQEIDDEPALRDRLVGAYILGSSVSVPEGELVGGSFQNVPLCEATDQTGCAVTFASFRSTSPPPDGSFFGRPRNGEGVAGCVNPAKPEGGSTMLQPYFSIDQPPDTLLGGTNSAQPFADPARTDEVTTPWVMYPEFVEGECVTEGGYTYLKLTVHADPDDPRTDDIPGDLSPEWGMHLVDANVAMGDIVAMVGEQAEAYTS